MNVKPRKGWWDSGSNGLAYSTPMGQAYQTTIEDFLVSKTGESLKGKVDLILTSPPFPLTAPKRYGNLTGEDYKAWISSLAEPLSELLSPTGSIILEIGNAWERGRPVMSTIPLETLIEFGKCSELVVCQQFICNNTARLPSPAAWVTVRRIRLKDSFTHVWWFSKSPFPKASNSNVLQPYSDAMKRLLKRGNYNTGRRPSDHSISKESFLTDNGGAIASSVLNFGNTASPKNYRDWCDEQQVRSHPARMQSSLADFFINFLTEPGDLVFDPFGGSNTTGAQAETLQRRWVVTEPSTEYLLGSIGRFNRD